MEIVYSEENLRIQVFEDGAKTRTELHSPPGSTVVKIRRRDKGVEWSVFPDTNTYSTEKFPQESMPEGPDEYLENLMRQEWIPDGEERIDGKKCLKFIGRFLNSLLCNADGKTVCYVDIQSGHRLRELTYDKDENVTMTTHYSIGLPREDLFELPAGCKEIQQ